MAPDELTIAALRATYERGDRTPLEVAEALLGRAMAVNRQLTAFATLDPEGALDAAWAATRAFQSGIAPAPLAGIPLAIKDLFDTARVTTGYGSAMFADHLPDTDAALVTEGLQAGLVPLGKATTHEFAWGITSAPTGHGPVRNPWDPERVPGGSSGGSGAAVAAGLCTLAFGTDTAGSVRIPAALCGVAGFKPTFGRLPVDGVFALAPSFDHAGILGRSPHDLRTAMAVLTGGGGPDRPGASLAGLRIGLLTHPFVPRVDPAVAAVLAATEATLAGLGAELVPLTVALAEDPIPAFAVVQADEALAVHRARGLYPGRAAEYDPRNAERLAAAAERPEHEVTAARAVLAAARAATDAALATVDLAVAPVSGVVAPRHEDTATLRADVLPFTTLQNVAGVPACAVRAGFVDGLPVGVQLCGPRGADDAVLDAACALFDATPDVQAPWPALP